MLELEPKHVKITHELAPRIRALQTALSLHKKGVELAQYSQTCLHLLRYETNGEKHSKELSERFGVYKESELGFKACNADTRPFNTAKITATVRRKIESSILSITFCFEVLFA